MNRKHQQSLVSKSIAKALAHEERVAERKAQEAEERARVNAMQRTARRAVADRVEATMARAAVAMGLRSQYPIMGLFTDGVITGALKSEDFYVEDAGIPEWVYIIAIHDLELADIDYERVHGHMHDIQNGRKCAVCAYEQEQRQYNRFPIDERRRRYDEVDVMEELGLQPVVVVKR